MRAVLGGEGVRGGGLELTARGVSSDTCHGVRRRRSCSRVSSRPVRSVGESVGGVRSEQGLGFFARGARLVSSQKKLSWLGVEVLIDF